MNVEFKNDKTKAWIWFYLLIVICTTIRVIFILASIPGIQNDTPSYIALAHAIAQFNLSGDNGFRTPIYPVFILLFNYNNELIRIGQTILGLLILSGIYWISWHYTRSILVAWIAGALYGFNLAQIYFESNILTETLATFFIVLCILVFIIGIEHKKKGYLIYWMLGTGVLAALTALTRPLYLYVPVLLAIVLFVLQVQESLKNRIIQSIILILPAVLLIGGWSVFNYFRLGYFGPTTFTGYGLVDHSITFIQYAPDKYAKIRDEYLILQIIEGTKAVNVWDGYEQIQAATGETFVQLSKTLAQMSIYLIIHHPILYAKSVIITWIRFWNEPGWWTWPFVISEKNQLIFAYAWRIEKYLLVIVQNSTFLILVFISTIVSVVKKSRQLVWKENGLGLMALIIITASIIQAIMERGDVTRYSIPTQPFVACVVVSSIYILRYKSILKSRRKI
jgi:4-amino-4-deoxy-L-arabinose transferase-like glycosyltransferase